MGLLTSQFAVASAAFFRSRNILLGLLLLISPALRAQSIAEIDTQLDALREAGKWDAAWALANRAVTAYPNAPEGYWQRALILESRKEWERAIQELDQAIRLNPDYALAFSNRGDAYRKNQQFDRALADYDQAIRINPGRRHPVA